MSEKRFFTKINKNGTLVIIDKECHTEIIDMTLACEVLNRLDLKLKTYNKQLGEQQATIQSLKEENEKLKNKLNVTALELVDEAISMGKAVEISEMNYHEFLEYRQNKGKPMELQR